VQKILNFARRTAHTAIRRIARRRWPATLDPRNFQPALPVPSGYTREGILEALCSVVIDGSARGELHGYATGDLERFLHTLQLVPDGQGELLEIGANPYFITLLLRHFRQGYHLNLTNFFGRPAGEANQRVLFMGFDGAEDDWQLKYQSLNIEEWSFPFADGQMDIVVFCEVLEHMTNDPMHAMREIWRVLKPGGTLVLTTPNAARIENVAALVEGRNIYDVYSAYGPYGRHNREYTRHELHSLLEYCGFANELSFTANVHPDIPASVVAPDALKAAVGSIRHREHDFGQYLFTRWRKSGTCGSRRPHWLYRSYPAHEMTES
jgi:SAM-dependent methyltransferase